MTNEVPCTAVTVVQPSLRTLRRFAGYAAPVVHHVHMAFTGPSTFTVARDPDPDGTPYLVRIPIEGGGGPLTYAVAEPWPSEERLRCEVADWPEGEQLEVVDECAVTSAVRRGPVVDVLLDRGVRNRAQFVLAPVEVDDRGSAVDGAEEAVFWQTPSTAATAAPRQRVPTARERGVTDLTVLVDTREQRHWEFSDHAVVCERRKLDAGDYGVERDGQVIAVVERKKTSDFAKGLMRGRMPSQMAALAQVPRAAVVVESSYANVLRRKRIARARMADLIASVQAAYPSVPIVFAGSRGSAQEWTYHFLAACLSHHDDEVVDSPLDPRAP